VPLHAPALNQSLLDVPHPVVDEVEEGHAAFLHSLHPLAVLEQAVEFEDVLLVAGVGADWLVEVLVPVEQHVQQLAVL
jgi:hypothetical protein